MVVAYRIQAFELRLVKNKPMQVQSKSIVLKFGFWQKPSTVLFCTLLLASCITANLTDWPDSIPGQRVFIDAYSADKENQHRQSQTEYLQWMLSFYQGNLAYQRGWLDIQAFVFEAPTAELGMRMNEQLSQLGVAIGSEWAKDNDIRRIDSRMLSLWGSTIQLAPDFEKQQRSIEVIAEDVNQLLTGNLGKEDVQESRYAEILGLDLFRDF